MKHATQQKVIELIERYPALESYRQSIVDAIEIMIASFRAGGKLMTCGNGGSAADAQHIVGELMKGFVLARPIEKYNSEFVFRLERECPEHAEYFRRNLQSAIPAISLVGETALMTAFSNDQAGDLIFAQQVLGLGRASDVLLAITTSGNSLNVVYAVEAARALDVKTIVLTGESGGVISSRALADVVIKVPASGAFKVQEYHLPIYHALCLALEAEFFSE